ncbi:MAG: TetR/AcrR family transcriptional regulator [Roseicyclus sp.]|jgi:AcrR family transcriptional regulator
MVSLNKTDMLSAMSAHVRAHGLAGASLRPLARAAGTSDRMLIYHFGSKDGLMAALLSHLADQMAGNLSAAMPKDPAEGEADCLSQILALLRTSTFAPDVRIWFDILSAAARGDAAHVAAGHVILNAQVQWIAARLPAGTRRPNLRAREILAVLQGVLVMDAVGMTKAADAAVARFCRDTAPVTAE